MQILSDLFLRHVQHRLEQIVVSFEVSLMVVLVVNRLLVVRLGVMLRKEPSLDLVLGKKPHLKMRFSRKPGPIFILASYCRFLHRSKSYKRGVVVWSRQTFDFHLFSKYMPEAGFFEP